MFVWSDSHEVGVETEHYVSHYNYLYMHKAPRYNGLTGISVIADIVFARVKGYSRK
jgi:hypothetical protein